jgi:hypothetical protein
MAQVIEVLEQLTRVAWIDDGVVFERFAKIA